MSLYKNEVTINGVKCGLVLRDGDGYTAIFEREFANLEDIEGIQWDAPEVEGPSILPEGWGFEVKDITYAHSERCWRVRLALGKQHMGDVTGYQERIAALEEERDALQAALDAVEHAQADSTGDLPETTV